MDSYRKVTIGDSKNVMYVNEKTNKGRQLIACHGIVQPKVADVWQAASLHFSPELVLDLGVGYGDILFSTDYHKNAKVIGFEEQEEYEAYHNRSKAEHSNGDQITFIYGNGVRAGLDSLKTDVEQINRLLFKINVNGNEPEALKGLEPLIKGCNEVVGILDFNSIYLNDSSKNIDEYLTYLDNKFDVYVLKTSTKLIKLLPLSFPILKRTFKKPYIVTDFLLVSNPKLVNLLGFRRSRNYLDRGYYYIKE
ncbi:hypothetical protein [Ferdinandcohnia sp. Marseille-Q9671]